LTEYTVSDIEHLLNGREELDEAVEDCGQRADGEPGTDELFDAVEDVRDLEPDEVSGTGYVVDTLQASLYYALTAESYEEAVVNAVNGGAETDTIGAVTGVVAGARFGESEIPNRWLSVTESVDTVESVAEDIHQI
jgi:ADP-ribosyl-[dinitrogen reductase] hydrolase